MTNASESVRARVGGGARRGFTLTEMLIVVVIIVILISILLPAVGGARNSARRATTESFISSVHQAVGQFRAAEQRMPGYFSVREVGGNNNFINEPGTSGLLGLTYQENALIDLAGKPYEDQSPSAVGNYNDPDSPPDIIRVGVGNKQEQQVNIQRTALGSSDGPGYLDLPEGFVDMGGHSDRRAGTYRGHWWMPRLVDAWGTPLLMWPRDEFAPKGADFAKELFDSGAANANVAAASFYWVGNAAFTCAPRLGRSQRNQWGMDDRGGTSRVTRANSALSANGVNVQRREDSVAAICGHPAFPEPTSLEATSGPVPAEARGDVVLQSAGSDGQYLETKEGQFDHYHYVPNSMEVDSDASWMTESLNFLENSNDIILAGS